MKTQITWMDGVAMSAMYPLTFSVPTQEQKDALKPGMFVKVGVKVRRGMFDGERFWVRLTHVDAGALVGVVDNDLVMADKIGFDCGDEVRFADRNVLQIFCRMPSRSEMKRIALDAARKGRLQ